ncbi:MAG TPA: hypothetical protein IAC57_03300 [Candidatus Scatosoma pullistercoris]|uniref:Uncharacterized protein n=1 Tax=Candidatus Scatosoma pullistercoris TaxID=2840934 RepID=A0A9D1MF41_9FIRM|nr:hypothetical protein [Candidatus Scatosoma pullistercoris]
MTSADFLSIFLFLYLAGILFLALKFRDIVLTPEKYEDPGSSPPETAWKRQSAICPVSNLSGINILSYAFCSPSH